MRLLSFAYKVPGHRPGTFCLAPALFQVGEGNHSSLTKVYGGVNSVTGAGAPQMTLTME